MMKALRCISLLAFLCACVSCAVLPPINAADEKTWANSIGMEFVQIPAGSFTMGSDYSNIDDEERPPHRVTISQPFYLGKYEVTQRQWEAVMGAEAPPIILFGVIGLTGKKAVTDSNPSEFKGPDNPVENVSWYDVQEFIRRLHLTRGEAMNEYRLPTEAEWEYAARAGTVTEYSFGDKVDDFDPYVWCGNNSGGKTHPVGQKKPNPWGLYDMQGNIMEWVQDWYGNYSSKEVADPKGPSKGKAGNRVIRGTGWDDGAWFLRSAGRIGAPPDNRSKHVGFRLVVIPGGFSQAADSTTLPMEPTSAEEQYDLAAKYFEGRGVPQDDRQAVAWFQKAADQGLAEAQTNLGLMYAKGRGVPKDERQAVAWYQKAADRGDADAQVNLGNMYDEGRGVPKDERQAVAWYQKAADQGNEYAQVNLGSRYYEGRGVSSDRAKACALWRLAADQGNNRAIHNYDGCKQISPPANAQTSTGSVYVANKDLRGTYHGGSIVDQGVRKAHGRGVAEGKDRYKGEFKRGLLDGLGVLVFGNGNGRYEGSFKDGKFNGYGVVSFMDNTNRYEGEFKDGKPHGRGILAMKSTGESAGCRYEGDFKNDKFHGRGVYVFKNGDKYEGEFKDDEYNGHGILIKDGKRFEGEFKDGEPLKHP